MDDKVVREALLQLLTDSHAQVGARKAVEDVRPDLRNARPFPGGHSVWEQLEHMRITQEDILRYTLDPAWQSPEWPSGYWPSPVETVTDEMWSASVARFLAELDEVVAMVQEPARDLTARIPHGEWRTYLRQVLLVAEHNAYHVGQIVLARRALGDWPG